MAVCEPGSCLVIKTSHKFTLEESISTVHRIGTKKIGFLISMQHHCNCIVNNQSVFEKLCCLLFFGIPSSDLEAPNGSSITRARSRFRQANFV